MSDKWRPSTRVRLSKADAAMFNITFDADNFYVPCGLTLRTLDSDRSGSVSKSRNKATTGHSQLASHRRSYAPQTPRV